MNLLVVKSKLLFKLNYIFYLIDFMSRGCYGVFFHEPLQKNFLSYPVVKYEYQVRVNSGSICVIVVPKVFSTATLQTWAVFHLLHVGPLLTSVT